MVVAVVTSKAFGWCATLAESRRMNACANRVNLLPFSSINSLNTSSEVPRVQSGWVQGSVLRWNLIQSGSIPIKERWSRQSIELPSGKMQQSKDCGSRRAACRKNAWKLRSTEFLYTFSQFGVTMAHDRQPKHALSCNAKFNWASHTSWTILIE